MKTSGSSFDLIMQELLNQKQVLEELEAENQEFRRQIAELREGHGVFVEILGERFSLHAETVASPETAAASAAQPASSVDETPTTMIEAVPLAVPLSEGSEPTPGEQVEQETVSLPPVYLEEMLLDEFTSASTNPIAVWSSPRPDSEPINEEDKEILRRELMGSFLLE